MGRRTEKNRFSSASAQSSPKLQKEDGKYPNRLAFLVTDCNLLLSVSDTNPLHGRQNIVMYCMPIQSQSINQSINQSDLIFRVSKN